MEENNLVSKFEAPAHSARNVVSCSHSPIVRTNQIPDSILNDEFLSSLIHQSLPHNYNFEIHKTIWKIKQTQAKCTLLQFPEGLIRFGPVIVDIMNAYFNQNQIYDVRFITMGDLTYGACCIDDFLAVSMGCDLIVHYAHSCLVPINTMNSKLKYLYVFLDIKFNLDHLKKCIEHNFNPRNDVLALASTIQFVSSVHQLAQHLRSLDFEIVLPQSRPLSSAEVIGCTAPKLDPKVNTIIFICDGRFHLEALMIANSNSRAFRYDPYSRKLTSESYDTKQMIINRSDAISQGVRILNSGGTVGIILGTLGRQGNESVFKRLTEKIKGSSHSQIVKFLLPEVVQPVLDTIDHIDIWVQIACPRLSIDWGHLYKKPLLNSYELARCIKNLRKPVSLGPEYPMDFYAKLSCGDHTPNHVCTNNPNCFCMSS